MKLEKPDDEKIYRWTGFPKLDNNKWKMHTGARAREQKYISIYISLCMKTFLKTGVYIYLLKTESLDNAILAFWLA